MATWITQRTSMPGIAVVLFALIQATSQEIWVAVENRLQSVSGQEILVPGARYLSGLAIQEDAGGPVFWTTDAGKEGAGLYRVQRNGLASLVYQDPESTYFESVVYSPATQSVYLTSPSTNSILRVNNHTGVQRLAHYDTKKPSGLAYDPCSRSVFWTNTARGSASIEVWQEEEEKGDQEKDNVKETNEQLVSSVLVSGNMSRPRGLTLDSPEGMLYWTDQVQNEYTIWRVGVSGGGGRSLVCRGRGSEPFSLAVTEEHVYWSDWASHALYRVEKNGNCSVELMSRFKASKPSGLAAVQPTTGGPPSCDQRTAKNSQALTQPPPPSVPASHVISLNSETTTKENASSSHDSRIQTRCGSPWEYYCLQGSCLELEGLPLCLCSPGWEGDRCEKEKAGLLPLSQGSLQMLVLGLLILSLLLLFSLLFLSVILHRFRKRPRIVRKRFISVARESKKDISAGGGATSCGLALEEGIQLDIENCCNMTLCDTPCFEPPSRVPKDLAKTTKSCSSSPKKPTKLDRQSLLESDDDNEEDLLF